MLKKIKIPRRIEVKKIEKALPWVLIYGRRKTGKSFLVENFLKFDKYFFVNRDGTLLDKETNEIYTYEEFLKILKEILGVKTVIIDEFHRLPENFLDYLHATGIKSKLILITSTLWLTERKLKRGEPLLGLVRPVKIGLIDEREIIDTLSKEFEGKELIENCVYLREPFLIPSFKGNIRDFLPEFLENGKIIIKEMIGEIFKEEERELTNIYEGIMKAVACRKNISTEISTYLFSRKIIPKDNPGLIQKYLDILTKIGILEKVEVFGKKRFRYFHSSPLLDLHYYLEEKYSYTETNIPSELIRKVLEEKLPKHVEQFIRNLFVKIFGIAHKIIEEKDLEVDVALFEFKKPKIVAEVKWVKKLRRDEVESIEENLNSFKECRKILVVPDKNIFKVFPENIEVFDVKDIVNLSKESLKNQGTNLESFS
jgi:hypothetical protein